MLRLLLLLPPLLPLLLLLFRPRVLLMLPLLLPLLLVFYFWAFYKVGVRFALITCRSGTTVPWVSALRSRRVGLRHGLFRDEWAWGAWD